jgi:hypothetical protein
MSGTKTKVSNKYLFSKKIYAHFVCDVPLPVTKDKQLIQAYLLLVW